MKKGGNAATVRRIARHYAEILRLSGFDPTVGDLAKTPLRAAKAFWEMTEGHRTMIDHQMRMFKKECKRRPEECSNMHILRGIKYASTCEHHLLPFFGTATIGYIPNETIIGVSKFSRIVEHFADRLQNQERLAHDIAEYVEMQLHPLGVAVFVEGKHTCSMARGVEDHASVFDSFVLRGEFLTDPAKGNQFLSSITRHVT